MQLNTVTVKEINANCQNGSNIYIMVPYGYHWHRVYQARKRKGVLECKVMIGYNPYRWCQAEDIKQS